MSTSPRPPTPPFVPPPARTTGNNLASIRRHARNLALCATPDDFTTLDDAIDDVIFAAGCVSAAVETLLSDRKTHP